MSARAPDELDRTLSALADPRRRRVLELLRERPRAAGELARATGLSPPVMSRQLRMLRQSGLVAESHPEFDARVRVYALTPKPMADLIAWLIQTEGMWRDQLSAFEARLRDCGESAG